jgi:hypothetical protein
MTIVRGNKLWTTLAILLLSAGFTLINASVSSAEVTTGMALKLKFLESIRSGRSKRGDMIRFAVVDDVKTSDGRILIPDGTKAFGTVTNSRSSGLLGRRGALDFSVDYTYSWDNKKVELTANKEKRGGGSQGATIAAGIIIAPIALLFRGSNISVQEGTELTAYLAEDIRPGSGTTYPGKGATYPVETRSRMQTLLDNMKNRRDGTPSYPGASAYTPSQSYKRVNMFNGDFFIGTIASENDEVYVMETKSGQIEINKAEVESMQTVKM